MALMRTGAVLLALACCLCGCANNSKVFDLVIKGDTKNLRVLVAADPASANAVGSFGVRPIMTAVSYRDVEAVRILLAAGASVRVCDSKSGMGPIQWARSDIMACTPEYINVQIEFLKRKLKRKNSPLPQARFEEQKATFERLYSEESKKKLIRIQAMLEEALVAERAKNQAPGSP